MYKWLKVWKEIYKDRRVRYLAATCATLGILLLSYLIVPIFVPKEVQIADVFRNSKVVTTQSSIEMAGQYVTKSLKVEEKQEVLKDIANSIGLEVGEDDFILTESDNVVQVSVERESKVAKTRLQFVSVNVNEASEIPVIQNYVLVHLEVYDQVESIMEYKTLLKKCFDRLEMDEQSAYVQFIGKYPGALTLDSKNEIADEMIENLHGKITYENRADDLYTVYAYASGISEYISVGNSKVNVQVAMNYDEDNNETMVYLATPILNGCY